MPVATSMSAAVCVPLAVIAGVTRSTKKVSTAVTMAITAVIATIRKTLFTCPKCDSYPSPIKHFKLGM